MLARAGIDAYGVDIDARSLELVRRQSDQMGLSVKLEQGVFGEGFDGQVFDRILFFESFHHAFDFKAVLLRLHDRLKRDGSVVFCGEPIVDEADDAVPYPWGPRMDALSILCIRRHGWMELGYQRNFFLELLMWCGWSVQHIPGQIFRSAIYLARPWRDRLELGDDFALGQGWSLPQGDHRWTTEPTASLPLPWLLRPSINLSITIANFLDVPKAVRLEAGETATQVTLAPGETRHVVIGRVERAREILIHADLTKLPNDPRMLGIAVLSVDAAAV